MAELDELSRVIGQLTEGVANLGKELAALRVDFNDHVREEHNLSEAIERLRVTVEAMKARQDDSDQVKKWAKRTVVITAVGGALYGLGQAVKEWFQNHL